MEKRIILLALVFVLFSCTKNVINYIETDIKHFYSSKEEIIKDCKKIDNYIIDTLSINYEDRNLFLVVEDFGSGEHIIEVKIFSKVKNILATSVIVKNTKTSKVYFKVDKENRRLIVLSKSEKEIISLPFYSPILAGNVIFYDD